MPNYKKPLFWIIVIAIIASVAVAVCFLTNPKTRKDDEHLDTEVSEGYFMPCTGGSYLMIDDFGPTELLPENGDNSIFDNLTVGDKINVEHGEILLTYPPMTTVFNIEKISDGGISDIPAGIVAELKDMGWIVATDSTTSSTDDYNSSITQEK